MRLFPEKWSGLTLERGQHGGMMIITPLCWSGMMMQQVQRPRCRMTQDMIFGGKIVCCLPSGHEGWDHLACTEELVARTGTMCPVLT